MSYDIYLTYIYIYSSILYVYTCAHAAPHSPEPYLKPLNFHVPLPRMSELLKAVTYAGAQVITKPLSQGRMARNRSSIDA